MRTNTTALLLAACLGLAACGGDDEREAAAGGRADLQDALQEYAECMREQGIDFPDPRPGGGPQIVAALGRSSPDDLRAAEKACAEHREAIEPPELSEEQQREFKEAALANARCMREQGVDMPDPRFGANGKAEIRLGEGGFDPTDPKFREAQEACADTLPRLGEDGP